MKYTFLLAVIFVFIAACTEPSSQTEKKSPKPNSVLTPEEVSVINDLRYYYQPEEWKLINEQHPAYIQIPSSEISQRKECVAPSIQELNEITHLAIKHQRMLEIGFIPVAYKARDETNIVPSSTKITYGRCRWSGGGVHGEGYLHTITLVNEEKTLLKYTCSRTTIEENKARNQHLKFLQENKESPEIHDLKLINQSHFVFDGLVYRVYQGAGHYVLEICSIEEYKRWRKGIGK